MHLSIYLSYLIFFISEFLISCVNIILHVSYSRDWVAKKPLGDRRVEPSTQTMVWVENLYPNQTMGRFGVGCPLG